MTLTSALPEFLTRRSWPDWIGGRLGKEASGEGLVVPAFVARAHQVLDADDRTS